MLIQSTDKGIKRELTNSAPYSGTISFYVNDLARIKVEEPEEHAAMIAEYKNIEAERNGSDA